MSRTFEYPEKMCILFNCVRSGIITTVTASEAFDVNDRLLYPIRRSFVTFRAMRMNK